MGNGPSHQRPSPINQTLRWEGRAPRKHSWAGWRMAGMQAHHRAHTLRMANTTHTGLYLDSCTTQACDDQGKFISAFPDTYP